MDPATAALILGGGQLIGGLIGGIGQGRQNAQQLAESRRQFEATQRWLREQLALQQQMQREQMSQQDSQFRSTQQQNEDQFGAGFGQRENQFGANFAQGENQFGATFGQRDRQFGANYDQAERQFASRLGLDERMFGANFGKDERQFGSRFDQGERQYADQSAWQRAKYQDERANAAIGVQRALNMAPLNDQALFMLQRRAGATPGPLQVRDYTRGGVAGQGAPTGGYGDILQSMQGAAASYRPGMGGFDASAMRNALARYNDASNLPAQYQAQTYRAGTYTPGPAYAPGTYTPGPAYAPVTYTPVTYTPRSPRSTNSETPPPRAGDERAPNAEQVRGPEARVAQRNERQLYATGTPDDILRRRLIPYLNDRLY